MIPANSTILLDRIKELLAMVDLKDGESVEMEGSGARPYVLKNVGGVFSCSCPAWRNQSAPIERRTCKHLRKLRGEEAERERLGGQLPAKPTESGKKKAGPPLLLAQSWDNAMDLSGWWMSEKLDGVRAYRDGEQFLSRQGNVYHAPDWFVQGLPATPKDGELWIDRRECWARSSPSCPTGRSFPSEPGSPTPSEPLRRQRVVSSRSDTRSYQTEACPGFHHSCASASWRQPRKHPGRDPRK